MSEMLIIFSFPWWLCLCSEETWLI